MAEYEKFVTERGPRPAGAQKRILRRLPTPKWQGRANPNDFPLLASPALVSQREQLDFGGKAGREMVTFAYEARAGSILKYVGVAAPKGTRPSAYLIYFRHSAKESDYPGGAKLLELGIGDYFDGRMQVCRQVSASGKNVAVILPIAPRTSGEFESDTVFVSQCLKEIQADLFGGADAPLLLASNSDGILKMNSFMQNCRSLMPRVRAIYDFDGSFVKAAKSISLVAKAKVFRYEQTPLTLLPGETVSAHLMRKMAMNPGHVPLPHQRWTSYRHYPPTGAPDGNWLHHFMPTCMLHHGLAVTGGI